MRATQLRRCILFFLLFTLLSCGKRDNESRSTVIPSQTPSVVTEGIAVTALPEAEMTELSSFAFNDNPITVSLNLKISAPESREVEDRVFNLLSKALPQPYRLRKISKNTEAPIIDASLSISRKRLRKSNKFSVQSVDSVFSFSMKMRKNDFGTSTWDEWKFDFADQHIDVETAAVSTAFWNSFEQALPTFAFYGEKDRYLTLLRSPGAHTFLRDACVAVENNKKLFSLTDIRSQAVTVPEFSDALCTVKRHYLALAGKESKIYALSPGFQTLWQKDLRSTSRIDDISLIQARPDRLCFSARGAEALSLVCLNTLSGDTLFEKHFPHCAEDCRVAASEDYFAVFDRKKMTFYNNEGEKIKDIILPKQNRFLPTPLYCAAGKTLVLSLSLGKYLFFDFEKMAFVKQMQSFDASFLSCDPSGVFYLKEMGHHILAIRGDDLTPLWRFRTGREAAATLNAGRYFVIALNKALYVLSSTDGRVLRQIPTNFNIAGLAFFNDTVYVSSENDIYKLEI